VSVKPGHVIDPIKFAKQARKKQPQRKALGGKPSKA
jgi:hypothetical protein